MTNRTKMLKRKLCCIVASVEPSTVKVLFWYVRSVRNDIAQHSARPWSTNQCGNAANKNIFTGWWPITWPWSVTSWAGVWETERAVLQQTAEWGAGERGRDTNAISHSVASPFTKNVGKIKLFNLMNGPRDCSLLNRVDGFKILKKNTWIFPDFSDFFQIF